jgi:AraC-like DNA-binding protein
MALRKQQRVLPRRRVRVGPDALLRISEGVGTRHRVRGEDGARGETLLEGCCAFASLGFPLQLHAYDALELEAARSDITVPPALSVALILEGTVDASLDGRPLRMSAGEGPAGYLWLRRREARLERRIRAGQRVRKVNVTLPLNALGALFGEAKGAPEDSGLGGQVPGDLPGPRPWAPTTEAVRFAEEILATADQPGPLPALSSHIAALSILRSALGAFLGREPEAAATADLSVRDVGRAYLAREFVLAHLDEELQIPDIARHTGMSVSTLQRVFRSCFGMTVIEFVRVRRLERARAGLREGGLTVGEAAFRAGYSSPANFATAFHREFGYPPSSCIRAPGLG